ncbi:hypothetical protein SK177_004832 [Salmonella enterica]|uniref:hypothetical protein n=2 Tax=Escherichia coli TaxID=562 RepID=UPI0005E2D6C2|nr:hypothetical protein [Escherichia coli]ELX7690769.1 hypothetical protein [Salmonella enterica]CHY47341.1 Uncharacterised protein [Salmonella enterica subsp. enterica serovar Typhi]EKJ0018933.1 hypothetical protein [Escherichia coli]ELX7693122.1 hypothetical protein [Salmonella enterica]MDS1628178.1 hypothetical protein [Escherichia coli]
MNLDGSHKIIGLSPLLIFSLLALCLRAIFFIFANNAFIMINDPITPKIIIPTIKRLKRHTAELADYMRLYRARVRGSQLADRHRQHIKKLELK